MLFQTRKKVSEQLRPNTDRGSKTGM